MTFSIKQLLLLILFTGFASGTLLNSERTFMIEMVKVVTVGTLVIVAYETWANVETRRAYFAGFLIWGAAYYLLHIVMRPPRIDLGTDTLLLWIGRRLENGRIMWAVFERTGHLLLSVAFGFVGGLITVYFYRKRQRMLQRALLARQ